MDHLATCHHGRGERGARRVRQHAGAAARVVAGPAGTGGGARGPDGRVHRHALSLEPDDRSGSQLDRGWTTAGRPFAEHDHGGGMRIVQEQPADRVRDDRFDVLRGR